MKLLLLAVLVAAPAFAATTDTLFLKGVVPAILSIDVTPTTLATTLPLETSQVNGHVADVVANWNTLNGARITITSANGGQLQHTSVPSSSVPYTLQGPGTGAISVATPVVYDVALVGPQGVSAPLGINYTGVPLASLVEGDYTDTLTFTISAL